MRGRRRGVEPSFLFPKREDELRLLADYHAHDTTRQTASPGQVTPTPGVDE